MLLDISHSSGIDTEPRDSYRALGRPFPNMDRVVPAATSRDYHNPVQGPSSTQSAPYHHDAGDYQRQPHHSYSSPNHAGSSYNNGRHLEYVSTAESRPASFDSEGYQSNKKPRLGHDQNGRQRPQYDSYASSHHHRHSHYSRPAHGPSSSSASSSADHTLNTHSYRDAGGGDYVPGSAPGLASGPGTPSARPVAQRPLAPRPLDNGTSLPRFSVPIMHSPPQAPHQAPSDSSYPSRSETRNSPFPSPPLISPLNGSPYSRRESALSGDVPAAPSPSSSRSSNRDDSRASQYSAHSQNQGGQYFYSAPSGHGPPPPGPPPRGGPPQSQSGPAHQQYPPMQGSHPADGRPRDPQYPYQDVPYSSGPMQFQFSQPYNTLSQQWAPSLPSDFEEREALCDSTGVIRKKHPADGHHYPRHQQSQQSYPEHSDQQQSHCRHPSQYRQHQQHPQNHSHYPQEYPQPPPNYEQYEQHHGRDYKQQIDRQNQRHQEEILHRQQQQDKPRDRPQEPQRYDGQRHYEHHERAWEQSDYLHHHDHQHQKHQYQHQNHYQYHDQNQHHEHPQHPQHPQHQYHEHTRHPHHYHDYPSEHGPAPNEHYTNQQHSQHSGHTEGDDGIPGWEPEIKPRDIEAEHTKWGKAEQEARAAVESQLKTESTTAPDSSASNPTSVQSSPPTTRAAPLHDILHPVNTTPLLKAVEIPVRPATETHAVPIPTTMPAPTVVPVPVQIEDVTDDYSEENGSSETTSPQGGKTERRQRGVFTQEQRDETSQTRTYGACLRCKSQRVRCVPSPLGPYDMCMTCEQVSRNSKKVLHSIRCVRWRLTAMTTYRSGGLELTKRWEGTEVHNVGDWVNDDIKEIDMKLYYSSHMHRYDLCDTPVKLRIREFAPLPNDVLTRKWSKRVVAEDGTPTIEKKVATLPAFALADVDEAEKALDSYFKTNTIKAMYDATRHSVPIIREHYHAAIRHYQSFPDGDFEKTFLEKFFRLWFYTRFTTGSSYISGGDKLGCKPITDPDYPMGNRISVPRMITAQCDSIMVTKFLKPLSHDLILELEKIFRTGNPDNWFTLYICTFMLLGEVSFSSQDRRRHGTDNWITDTPYSLYEFVSDLQFGGNILLCYWHYYRTMDPMDSGWDIFCQVIEPPLAPREKIESAKGKGKKKVHVTQDQRQLVMSHWPSMVELADILSTVHHNKSFEHPLYFVSQMYMREWEIREVYTYTPPGCKANSRLNMTRLKN